MLAPCRQPATTVELVLLDGDDLEAHVGVGLAAELGALAEVDAGSIRLDRHHVLWPGIRSILPASCGT